MVNVLNPIQPWFQDLQTISADGVITKKEVDTKIAPYGELVRQEGGEYNKAMKELLGETSPKVRLTTGGKKALEILAAGPPAITDGLNHFSAGVKDLAWGPGPSITMTVLLPYIDVKPSYKVKVDEAKRAVTVTLDGTTTSEYHFEVLPAPIALEIPMKLPKQIGKSYKLIVRDGNTDSFDLGKIIAETKFKNLP